MENNRPLKDAVDSYQRVRESMQRTRSNLEEATEKLAMVRKRLKAQLRLIRQLRYERFGCPLGASATACDIWNRYGQYTTRN
ncbi:MAG: hypothetical protein GVY15_06575 [Bacteroidetes bacterium]|jgi:pyruvate formate-lyase activating enzyme-like uncharacterized protein|nr:hypothetical protein [Bacteroidota bacterium]